MVRRPAHASLVVVVPFIALWALGIFAQAASSASIEGFLLESAKQTPALLALIWCVVQFLKHLRAKDADASKREADRDATVRTLGDNCHEFQASFSKSYAESMTKVAASMERSVEMMGRMIEVAARMDRATSRMDEVFREFDRVAGKGAKS